MSTFTGSAVERATLAWLESAGWQILGGATIAPGEPAAERDDQGNVQKMHIAGIRNARMEGRLCAGATTEKSSAVGVEGSRHQSPSFRALHRAEIEP